MSRARILVVDDNLKTLHAVRLALEGAGYRVFLADDPGEAIRLAGEVQPDLAILDVSMPEMDGFELSQYFRWDRQTRRIPLMFLTAHKADPYIHEANAVGAIGYLEKPFRNEALLALVEDILQRIDQEPTCSPRDY